MISEKWFKYYTSQEFNYSPSGITSLDTIYRINELAEETVKNRKEVLSADDFETNSEYQCYLLAVSQCAWAEKLGAVIEEPFVD